MILVAFDNDFWYAHISLRESLFVLLRESNPDLDVLITRKGTSNDNRTVKIRYLELYSEWRNT